MQGFHQPAISVDSLHVEDGSLTYVCILFYLFSIKISHQLSVRAQRVCISIRSLCRGERARRHGAGGGKGQLRGLMGGRAGERSSSTACDSVRCARVFIAFSSACPSSRCSCGTARRQHQRARVRKSPALIKPRLLLTKQKEGGKKKIKYRMTISALPPQEAIYPWHLQQPLH